MFRTSQKQTVVADLAHEKPVEPKRERPMVFRLEQLEERVAPAITPMFNPREY
jgi:hypothetical protein